MLSSANPPVFVGLEFLLECDGERTSQLHMFRARNATDTLVDDMQLTTRRTMRFCEGRIQSEIEEK